MTSIASRAAAASPTRPWPADRVDQWPIERLIPYANNPRLHSAADVERIAASILKWGWTNPVLVDEQGVLIAGHGRVAAAAKLGLTVPIPVIVARGWSEEEKQAYRLADNELAARGSWDPDLLRSELGDLKFNDFDLDLIGFEPDRLEAILAGLGASGLSDPDSIPQVPDHPVTGSGDVWRLGDHCVGCGDSTNAANVEPVLAGSQPHDPFPFVRGPMVGLIGRGGSGSPSTRGRRVEGRCRNV
jgi:ParB-like nuclease domain